ncbi:MAG: hypothetical protein AABZ12_00310 [Planctomycetota bacterium]
MRKKAGAGRGAKPESGLLADRVDRDIAASAIRKIKDGGQPTARETQALRRFEKARREQQLSDLLRAIPQRIFRECFGEVQAKQLRDWEQRYGFPVAVPVVDLWAFGRRFRAFLAENAHRILVCGPTGDPMLDGPESPALERYRDEKAKLARLDRLEREGALLARDMVHHGLGRLVMIFRGASEQIQRQFGVEAHGILKDAVDEYEREMWEWLEQDKEIEGYGRNKKRMGTVEQDQRESAR